jgi:hypothetical protein
VAGGVASGFRCHSGWAVVVNVTGSPRAPVVVSRRRVELVTRSLPRQPYHAVAEEGAGRSVIAAVERAALEAAAGVLRSTDQPVAVGVIASERQLPHNLDDILASHARLHAAEGRLYEQAVLEAAARLGIPVTVLRPDAIRVSAAVEALGRRIGAPWQKDHKWATTAALAALGARG